MTNQKKSPIGWFVLAFAAGLSLAGWGWDKNESTIPARTIGAVPMIVVGCALIVGSIVGFFSVAKTKK